MTAANEPGAAWDAALESLSNRLRAIQDGIKELREAEADVKARIRATVGEATGPIEAYGKTVLEVTYGRRFDPDLAATVLASTPDLLAACSETVISSAKAKAVLAPAMYELCQKPADQPTIKPKVARA